MHHRLAVIVIAAAAAITVAACADQEGGSRLSTEPGNATPSLNYITTGTAAIVNPKTHHLETVSSQSVPNGVSASIVGSSVTNYGMQIGFFEPGLAPAAGSSTWTFTDSAKHVHTIVLLYRTGGGPPAAMQHYTDGALVSTTAYSWMKNARGYLRTQSILQIVRKGALIGTYTTVTVTALPKSPLNPGPVQTVRFVQPHAVSPLQHTLGTVAYALAFAFAPQDATAQSFYFYACRQQWLHYAGAAALLAGSAAALAAAPELTPVLLTTFVGLLASTAAMEDLLIDCMLANDSVASGGFGGSGGFGSGGGTGGAGGGYNDCLDGSYAAHCTSPFTL